MSYFSSDLNRRFMRVRQFSGSFTCFASFPSFPEFSLLFPFGESLPAMKHALPAT